MEQKTDRRIACRGRSKKVNKEQQQKLREDTVQRLIIIEALSENDARMLVEIIGVDWSSLKREADLMKVEAVQARLKPF